MQISVVIPAHNESGNLPRLIDEIRDALAGKLQYEVIVIDDGSSDDTASVLHRLRGDNPELKVLRHRKCCGQSTSLMTGIDAARGRFIGTLDGDGQNDPHDLPTMLKILEEGLSLGVVMVTGHRTKRKDSYWRLLSSRIANRVRSSLLRDNTPDSGCGIKVFLRTNFLRIPRFDHMHRYLPALFCRDGGKVVSTPVNHRPRVAGRSHYGTMGRLIDGIVDLAGVSWLMRRSRRPQLVTESMENDI
ncbi:MAG: glycosyltransferase family 2 protein [Planctomyces sp.]|jgi:dolichol-phosphate mannosyltransferase